MRKHAWKYLLPFVVAVSTTLALWATGAVADEPLVVIVNPANTVSTLSVSDMTTIYRGEKNRWPNGKLILLLMAAPGSPERTAILKKIYKMNESEYMKYFIQASFTGEVSAAPKDVDSAAQIKQTVASNQGAIGYVKQSDADSTVKVILTMP
jgi:ABC-type phosphate transport system substrate-binding protein